MPSKARVPLRYCHSYSPAYKTTVDPAAAISGAIIAFKANLKERRNQIDIICRRLKAALKTEIRYATKEKHRWRDG